MQELPARDIMTEALGKTLAGFFGLVALGVIAWFLIGLLPSSQPKFGAFENSQMVRMKAFDEVGMVVWKYCPPIRHERPCEYGVRFLTGLGAPVVERMREFELEAIY